MMCENKTAISKYRHIISAITADYFAHGRRIIRSVQPDYTLLLRFDNGECRRLDMNPVIQAVCSSTWPHGRTSAMSILMSGTAFRGILTRMWTVKPCGTKNRPWPGWMLAGQYTNCIIKSRTASILSGSLHISGSYGTADAHTVPCQSCAP